MSDRHLRSLRRRAAHGGLDEWCHCLREGLRVGTTSYARLRLAGFLGHEAAGLVVGVRPPPACSSIEQWARLMPLPIEAEVALFVDAARWLLEQVPYLASPNRITRMLSAACSGSAEESRRAWEDRLPPLLGCEFYDYDVCPLLGGARELAAQAAFRVGWPERSVSYSCWSSLGSALDALGLGRDEGVAWVSRFLVRWSLGERDFAVLGPVTRFHLSPAPTYPDPVVID